MFITLLYHRAFAGKYGNSIDVLERHFSYIQKKCSVILPGDLCLSHRCNVCLSFDDATCDFYYLVYPLLKKYQLKVLLAVPAHYIQEAHTISQKERLALAQNFSFQTSPPSYAFCSFQELEEMISSGHVQIASHGLHHVDLTKSNSLEDELYVSKNLLEKRLNISIDTFVFPYGRYNQRVLEEARKHYTYVMRIGNALNFSWKAFLHYRVSADHIEEIQALFSPAKKVQYFMKAVAKRLTISS